MTYFFLIVVTEEVRDKKNKVKINLCCLPSRSGCEWNGACTPTQRHLQLLLIPKYIEVLI